MNYIHLWLIQARNQEISKKTARKPKLQREKAVDWRVVATSDKQVLCFLVTRRRARFAMVMGCRLPASLHARTKLSYYGGNNWRTHVVRMTNLFGIGISDQPKPELGPNPNIRQHCRYRIFGFSQIFGVFCRIPPNTSILYQKSELGQR
jgi:hypothetical protein